MLEYHNTPDAAVKMHRSNKPSYSSSCYSSVASTAGFIDEPVLGPIIINTQTEEQVNEDAEADMMAMQILEKISAEDYKLVITQDHGFWSI